MYITYGRCGGLSSEVGMARNRCAPGLIPEWSDCGLHRYNTLQLKGHWFPGTFATEAALAKVGASKAPAGMDVVGRLRETHRELYKAPRA
jgi:hypothetical protein